MQTEQNMDDKKFHFPIDSVSADIAECLAMRKQYTTEQFLRVLRNRQGNRTQKEFAEELGVTQQYLSDVYLRRREPGNGILKNLRIVRRVVFEEVVA